MSSNYLRSPITLISPGALGHDDPTETVTIGDPQGDWKLTLLLREAAFLRLALYVALRSTPKGETALNQHFAEDFPNGSRP